MNQRNLGIRLPKFSYIKSSSDNLESLGCEGLEQLHSAKPLIRKAQQKRVVSKALKFAKRPMIILNVSVRVAERKGW